MPFYWNWKRGRSNSTFVFPNYWRRSDSSSTSTILFPFLFERHGKKVSPYTVLFPFYWDVPDGFGGRAKMIFPSYFRRRHATPGNVDTFVMPFYWNWRRGDRSDTYLFPNFFRRADRHGSMTVMFPLLWDFRNKESSTTFFLPNFYRSTNGDRKMTFLFPAYWNWSRKGSSRTFILPGYSRWVEEKDGERSVWNSLPVLFDHEHTSKGRKYSTSLSLLWSPVIPSLSLFGYESSNKETKHHLFPLYKYSHRADGSRTKLSVLWPLYASSSDRNKSKFSILGPLFHHRSNSNGDHRWGLFYRFVWSEKRGDTRRFEFNPFFQYEKGKDSLYWQVLGGLLGYYRKGDKVTRKVCYVSF
jgi:hypothetical protein